ncbi:hypothetical protein EBZ35_07410 [bacterium]|nr:hypothetical protein [bacterium]
MINVSTPLPINGKPHKPYPPIRPTPHNMGVTIGGPCRTQPPERPSSMLNPDRLQEKKRV